MILWGTFDKNEIVILLMLVIFYSIFFLLPKKFCRDITALFFLWGLTIGIFFDFTIGGGLIDYYKLNDSNEYGLNDMLYYLSFAPFSYFFIYFYELLQINAKTFIWYVVGWSLLGVGLQWVFTLVDIVNFKNGYKLLYSLPVFMLSQTITGLYYQFIRSKRKVMCSDEKQQT
ncbi:hypothetical protein CFK37_17390 [Virgibacillus phasianinus]|uniref:Uncharacterized protein n=1 Tax=Virgibacillus phasianinus TaxID=2017483 RepID=A0A220U671_9BACI|nr:hypothetical protein [Virgibacillus phasianinus]ASK63804.1 hypothetical protein CFK37_17390 [Virgibacillus phasianinus]